MIEKIKRFFVNLWYSLPFAMKAGNDEILGVSNKDSNGTSISQEVSDHRVSKHLLKGEVTQEVEELRYRTYKVAEEAEGYQYIGNGVSIKGESRKNVKKIHKFIQHNELMVTSVLEELKRVGSYGTETYRFEFTYRDYPRFKLEQFATQVDVDINDGEGKVETSFHFSTRPNPYEMKSKPFITEVSKMEHIKNEVDAMRNEMASNIETFSFTTFKAHGEDSLVTYSFTKGAKFKSFKKTDLDIIVTYEWDEYTRVPADLSVKYYSKTMDEKYKTNAPKEVAVELVESNRKRYCSVCGREVDTYDGDIMESMNGRIICRECLMKREDNDNNYLENEEYNRY